MAGLLEIWTKDFLNLKQKFYQLYHGMCITRTVNLKAMIGAIERQFYVLLQVLLLGSLLSTHATTCMLRGIRVRPQYWQQSQYTINAWPPSWRTTKTDNQVVHWLCVPGEWNCRETDILVHSDSSSHGESNCNLIYERPVTSWPPRGWEVQRWNRGGGRNRLLCWVLVNTVQKHD
jgi:hypothetical protein